MKLTFIGFGEAASGFIDGWGLKRFSSVSAYDLKTDHPDASVRSSKWADYDRLGVTGCQTPEEALQGSDVVFSLVTADQAQPAAQCAADFIPAGSLYLDGNSCAPDNKRANARLIEAAGGRYVDVAIMAPVHPRLHQTPLLMSGSNAAAAIRELTSLELNCALVEGDVGSASSIKMIRSIMVKGMEALSAECVLAARRANVDTAVLESLERSFPEFGWKERIHYMLGRTVEHGVRRAAEMREVALTVEQLGLPPDMTRATCEWQQRIGELDLPSTNRGYQETADTILQRLNNPGRLSREE